MKPSFLKHITTKVPPEFRAEFDRKVLISSLYNIRMLSWIGFVFFVPLFFLDLLREKAGELNGSSMLRMTAIVHYALLFLFIPALTAHRYLRQVIAGQPHKTISFFVSIFPAIVFLLLFPNFVLTLIARNNILFYTIFIFSISVTVPLAHIKRLVFNTILYFIMLATIVVCFREHREMRYLLFIETTGVSLTAFLIATFMYNLQIREFVIRKELNIATAQSEALLLNILPAPVAAELKEKGVYHPRRFELVSILFADIKDFSIIAQQISPEELVSELHACFSHFDQLMTQYGLEKIKTIGDAYICVSGLPEECSDHAIRIVQAGLAMQDFLHIRLMEREKQGKRGFQARIGIHSGPVLAGVVGTKKYVYDIWGDAVNIAARCQEAAEVNSVNISGATQMLVKGHFNCLERGNIEVKNLGAIEMYRVEGG